MVKRFNEREGKTLFFAFVIIITLSVASLVAVSFLALSKTWTELIISPGNAEGKIIELITSAKSSIDVEMYIFTNEEIANSLVFAKNNGVEVRVIMEKRLADNKETAEFFSLNNVSFRWASTNFTLTHAKFAIIDDSVVVLGSHNWSKEGINKNREVSVVIEDSEMAAKLKEIFENDWKS